MKITIVYAHPYPDSFNHSILDKVIDTLKKGNISYDLIDLCKDNFNPVYDQEELALFSKGKTDDVQVLRYQESLKSSNEIIFIFPIWWNSIPAIVKGFVDKVMKKKFAYNVSSTGIKGKLTNLKSVTVFTTSTSPTWYFKWVGGNSIKKIFLGKTLKQVGIKKRKWINFGNIDNSTCKRRTIFLKFVGKETLRIGGI